MSHIALIVAPVDFAKGSTQALGDAATWAKDLGSELHLLHVVPDPMSQARSAEAGSVADYVVRAAPCPVLIIPAHAHSEKQPDATPASERRTAA